ncbi:hypothetical protein HALLA_15925 [Halostagnicola larsenii XH-48]|uniref:DUF8052 domain-containing protein n=1 Tax=Halostagnicola larsenii XH-48 TaxID=797299 RepID=W0JRZ4_9EURY|nr:hypothetical protein [Halostagnicola larsenii]AHG00067.1 hypothetical protein HALLA_15925 [Halostagnicola larsenii XH-48]
MSPANDSADCLASDDDSETPSAANQPLPPVLEEALPALEDGYLARVARRLVSSYDLESATKAGGVTFDLGGELRVESSKHLFHPSVSYANHHMREYLYADRRPSVSREDLDELVELGHELADRRVEPSSEHKATEFTFVIVAPSIPDDVRSFVRGFKDRTLLKYGLHGHYEIHCCVVAPDRQAVVASDRTEIDEAFAVWRSSEKKRGLLGRLLASLS